MSLRFYFGPSGSGKSHRIYEEIMQRAAQEPGRNFLIIVPDQFTMQTQKDLVMRSDRGGILNIDVLSFGRLSHRILEEVGTKEMPVLDDTGKSLVLQKIAADLKEQLPAMGSLLHKQGYIHEVKSAISEFMQYGISTQDMDKLIASAQKGRTGNEAQRLKDSVPGISGLYQRPFYHHRGDTGCAAQIPGQKVERSFRQCGGIRRVYRIHPIQNRLIQELMRVCEETIVTVTIGEEEDPYQMDGEQKLFHLSKKTVADLVKLAAEAEVTRGEDVFVKGGPNRFTEAPALCYLEQNLFRYQYEPYTEKQCEIRMFEALSPREEVHQTALYIRKLIREEGLTYRDIAVVIGDLEGYASYVETEFGQLEIPCFLDRTRGIVLNPMIEYIKSALQLYIRDFSYDTVFHFLRSGMADISREEIDELENYGIRTAEPREGIGPIAVCLPAEQKKCREMRRKTQAGGREDPGASEPSATVADAVESCIWLPTKTAVCGLPVISMNRIRRNSEIRMFEALSPREEVHQTALYIRHLIREEGLTTGTLPWSSEIWKDTLPMWKQNSDSWRSLFSDRPGGLS